MADVRMYAKPNVDIMLVGNKADLESKREVDFKKAKEYADRHKMLFMETSAKAGSNVETAFTRLTMAAVQTKLNEIADKKLKQDNGTSSTTSRPNGTRPSGHTPVALGEQPTRDDGGSCSC
jgi:GTPase SAR1 family protein